MDNGRFKKKYVVDERFLDAIGPEQAWFLGIMASDGCILSKNTFSLTQASAGKEIIDHAKEILSYTGPIYKRISKYESKKHDYNCNIYTLQITSSHLVKEMQKYGIVRWKTHSMGFPTVLPSSLHSAFIRGYIDGDGCVGIYHVGNSDKFLVIDIICTKMFAQTMKSICPVTPKIRRHSYKKMWTCRWNGENAVRFGKWVYGPESFRSRKYTKFFDYSLSHISRSENREPILASLHELLSAGMSIPQASKKLDIPFQTVYKWRQKGLVNFTNREPVV